jgi:hypothetical protein
MAKVWVLDTDTKGTGAQMVPLETIETAPPPRTPFVAAAAKPAPPPRATPAPRAEKEFKVVDVMTRRVLAEGTDARATVQLLEGIRSVVDVNIHVRDRGAEGWRWLTMGEKKLLWAHRRPR